jgi:hypothetical protein
MSNQHGPCCRSVGTGGWGSHALTLFPQHASSKFGNDGPAGAFFKSLMILPGGSGVAWRSSDVGMVHSRLNDRLGTTSPPSSNSSPSSSLLHLHLRRSPPRPLCGEEVLLSLQPWEYLSEPGLASAWSSYCCWYGGLRQLVNHCKFIVIVSISLLLIIVVVVVVVCYCRQNSIWNIAAKGGHDISWYWRCMEATIAVVIKEAVVIAWSWEVLQAMVLLPCDSDQGL